MVGNAEDGKTGSGAGPSGSRPARPLNASLNGAMRDQDGALGGSGIEVLDDRCGLVLFLPGVIVDTLASTRKKQRSLVLAPRRPSGFEDARQAADGNDVFFQRSEDLKQGRLVPLVIDAAADLGGTPGRADIIERAIYLGQFTEQELALPSHRKQDRELGRRAIPGRLRYAIWEARKRGDLLAGATDGLQTLTEQGRAKVGAATRYPELDARRILPGGSVAQAVLRPFVPAPSDTLEARSLSDTLPRTGVFDLDALERRTSEHHQLQQRAVDWLSGHGWTVGLAPRGTVLADLMAERDGRWLVVEIKTLAPDRPTLIRQQLRLGLGQVLEYRERLRAVYADTDAMLLLSAPPEDPTWERVAAGAGVTLAAEPLGGLPDQLTRSYEPPYG